VIDWQKVDFAKGGGFVTVVTVDARSGAVLMVARANREALEKTIATGEMHYHSRSRGLWRKGETSGNAQKLVSLMLDCDGDSVLARVSPLGPACHLGMRSCFGEGAFRAETLAELDATISERAQASDAPQVRPSYTRQLLADRNLRLKKLGEEAAELVTACADGDPQRAAQEAADLFYHALVALRAVGVSLDDVRQVLSKRAARREG
jgi:phosphoribosyl-ATP pyrophosphohydrolase/phosphoribosyl-AMP cyclohydrolase